MKIRALSKTLLVLFGLFLTFAPGVSSAFVAEDVAIDNSAPGTFSEDLLLAKRQLPDLEFKLYKFIVASQYRNANYGRYDGGWYIVAKLGPLKLSNEANSFLTAKTLSH